MVELSLPEFSKKMFNGRHFLPTIHMVGLFSIDESFETKEAQGILNETYRIGPSSSRAEFYHLYDLVLLDQIGNGDTNTVDYMRVDSVLWTPLLELADQVILASSV